MERGEAETVEGTIRTWQGVRRGRIVQYRGIRYGLAPRRFCRADMAPLPPVGWDGRRYGPAAPQPYERAGHAGAPTFSEDCLFLNVTAPAGGGPYPVLVWLHGGSFQRGSGAWDFAPYRFAREGIVTVTVNYRLGVLGFLDVSALLGRGYEEAGRLGVLDAALALRWVRAHIASFGGDPSAVTVMGQSAGAQIAAILSILPEAEGLFSQAVLFSGALQGLLDRRAARQEAERYLAALDTADVSALLTFPWEALLAAQETVFGGLRSHRLGPVWDRETEGDPMAALARRNRPLRILAGTNRDEAEWYAHVYGLEELDESSAEALFGERADAVLREYEELPRDGRFRERSIAFLTERLYRAEMVRMAEGAAAAGFPFWLYRLDWDRQSWRACHMSESQFFLGRSAPLPDIDHSPAQKALAAMMEEALLSFIRTGAPAAKGLPPWPPFTKEDRAEMIFDESCRVGQIDEAGGAGPSV